MGRKRSNETWCISSASGDPESLLYDVRDEGKIWVCRYKTEAGARRVIKEFEITGAKGNIGRYVPVKVLRSHAFAIEDMLNHRRRSKHHRRIRAKERVVAERAARFLQRK